MTAYTAIQGIDKLAEGVRLSFNAYSKDVIPEGYIEIHNALDDKGTGLQAKFLKKGSTVYVLVAGTNDTTDILVNWPTKGKAQFNVLEPALREVIAEVKGKYNIVVIGDSGGGLVAQHAHIKYGVDAFCTNTSGVWNYDERIDKTFRNPNFYYNNNGKMITVVNDGEPLSTHLGRPYYGEVYVIPNEAGALMRYLKEEGGHGDLFTGIYTAKEALAAHVGLQTMINYLDGGGKAYKPEAMNYGIYMWNHPNMMPLHSYSNDPFIAEEANKIYGRFGIHMSKADLAGVLGIPKENIIRGRDGFFVADLSGYPIDKIIQAKVWFDFKNNPNFQGIGGDDYSTEKNEYIHHYFKQPYLQLQDTSIIEYLLRPTMEFDKSSKFDDNIILQIGNRFYNTERYEENTD